MKSIIPTHIPHDYEREMPLKSIIVPLAMQLKDEKKYNDIVDILDYYEQELEDIYTKAGFIEKPAITKEDQTPTSTEGQTSAADQPGAHCNKADDNAHMKAISVPFGGYQMTRDRFASIKDLRSGAHTAKEGVGSDIVKMMSGTVVLVSVCGKLDLEGIVKGMHL